MRRRLLQGRGRFGRRVSQVVRRLCLAAAMLLAFGDVTVGPAHAFAAPVPGAQLINYPGPSAGGTVWVDVAGTISPSPYVPSAYPFTIDPEACPGVFFTKPCDVIRITPPSQYPNWTGRWTWAHTGSGDYIDTGTGFLDNGTKFQGSPETSPAVTFQVGNKYLTTNQGDIWIEVSAAAGQRFVGQYDLNSFITGHAPPPYTETGAATNPIYTGITSMHGDGCTALTSAPRTTTAIPEKVTFSIQTDCTTKGTPPTCSGAICVPGSGRAPTEDITRFSVGATFAQASLHSLRNVNSGFCLAIDQNHLPQGAPAEQADCNNRPDRTFEIAAVGGAETILALQQNGYCLDLPNHSISSGAQVVSSACTQSDAQRWYAVPNGDGTYGIFNANDGLCLDVAYESTAGYAPIVQGTCTGDTSQRWSLTS